MLQLKNIKKDYQVGDKETIALKGIDLAFRKNEFVAILGPSGCGKTTLLNIVGGLDKYSSGDLVIDGISTKEYKDRDWDAYRNHRIGFVFQNYNLINHMDILTNVELALTLSGTSPSDRKKRAREALEKVDLLDHIHKRPNQLSGGQMQRVAIARALVNDPTIVLADEPTGALDSKTSVQIMEILKEIAKDRLIIMVTHNPDLANKYSNRLISILDGEVTGDTNPYIIKEEKNVEVKKVDIVKKGKKETKIKTSMSFFTALHLSFNNLRTKWVRTLITALAGSIGIIGVALVLAISNGFKGYINHLQQGTISNYPLVISEMAIDIPTSRPDTQENELPEYPTGTTGHSFDVTQSAFMKQNHITSAFTNHLDEKITGDLVDSFHYSYRAAINFIDKAKDGSYVNAKSSQYYFNEINVNQSLVNKNYNVISGRHLVDTAYEAVLVVDKYNRVPSSLVNSLGLATPSGELDLTSIVGKEFGVAKNSEFYVKNPSGKYDNATITDPVYTGMQKMTVVGVIRIDKEIDASVLSTGIYYSPQITKYTMDENKTSQIIVDQEFQFKQELEAAMLAFPGGDPTNPNNAAELMKYLMTIQFSSIIEGESGMGLMSITGTSIFQKIESLGGVSYEVGVTGGINRLNRQNPNNVTIFPKDSASKKEIKKIINDFNAPLPEESKIVVTDFAEMMETYMNQMVDVVTNVLIAFAAISLFVSSVMIGIITYTSVIERTKEIGILRSIGARKKDISRVFNAETFIVGLAAGLLGILVSYIICSIISLIFKSMLDIPNIANLKPLNALVLIIISIGLTLIAGLIPSRLAAKKDPVVALRSE